MNKKTSNKEIFNENLQVNQQVILEYFAAKEPASPFSDDMGYDTSSPPPVDATIDDNPMDAAGMPASANDADLQFIATLYAIYFKLKVMHWNATTGNLHKQTDDTTNTILWFIDDYTEVSLMPAKGGYTNKTIDINNLISIINTTLDIVQNSSEPESVAVSIETYSDILRKILILATQRKDTIVSSSDSYGEAYPSDAELKAKDTLLDDFIKDISKALYLAGQFS